MTWCSLRVVGYHGHRQHGYVWAPHRRTFSFHTAKAELQASVGRQHLGTSWAACAVPAPSQSRLLSPLAARGWRAALTCPADRLCCRQVTDLQNKANKPCLELGSALSLQELLWRSSACFWQCGLGTQTLRSYELTDFFSLLFSWLTTTSALLTSSWGVTTHCTAEGNQGTV